MPPRKRSGSEAGATSRPTPSKAAKTGGSKPNSKAAEKAESSAKPPSSKKPTSAAAKGAKRGPKAPASGTFKARALPLHANLTHTPPAITDENTENAATADPGFLGAVTLVPSDFATGSYGWKGSKRFTVELSNPEDPNGLKEKVHVMLNINATVVGSKQAKGGKADAEDAEDVAEEADEEAAVDEEA